MYRRVLGILASSAVIGGPAAAQEPRPLLPIQFQNSAEYGWLQKPVRASRLLDDMTAPANWR